MLFLSFFLEINGVGEKPTTFTSAEDTRIPALQNHCHALAADARYHAARTFVTRLQAFLTLLIKHLSRKGLGQITEKDKNQLRLRWRTTKYHFPKGKSLRPEESFSLSTVKVDVREKETGLGAELEQGFANVVLIFSKHLEKHFRRSLEDRLNNAAGVAAGTAAEKARRVIKGLPWSTLRAMLRREGKWKCLDLNGDLADELLSLVVRDWRSLFSPKFFQDEAKKIKAIAASQLDAVVASVPPSLKEDACDAASLAGRIVNDNITLAMESARTYADSEQQNIRDLLSEIIRKRLKGVYDDALTVSGKGSIAIQRAKVPADIQKCAEELYAEGAKRILMKLDNIALKTGRHLDRKLRRLGRKAELSMSKLWGCSENETEQPKAFAQALGELQSILVSVPLLADRCGISSPSTAS